MRVTIKTKLIISMCVPLVLMAVFFVTSLINTENEVLKAERSNVKAKYAAQLEKNLKGQVDTLTRSISIFYEQSKLENIKKDLASEILGIKTTLEKIYKASESESEAATSIYAFLNQHRWDDSRYLFAYDASSLINKAHGGDLHQVGESGDRKTDAKGNYFVRALVASAKNNTIGFSEYSLLNPTSQKIEDKITASFYFKPLNLVVASEEYISILKQGAMSAALQSVTAARYGKNGYFLIQDKDGKILAHPKAKLVGKLGSTTPKISEEIRNLPEATVKTVFENPLTKKEENKINYARKIFPDWGWIIVTGAYESDIIAAQTSLTKATADIFNEKVNWIIIISAVLVVVFLTTVILLVSAIVRGLVVLKDRIDTLSTGEADLTSRIEITSNNELGDIGHAINHFIGYLQLMILDISQASANISQNISQLNMQSEQNNQALLSHSGETEQVVSAITQMSATSESVAHDAAKTANNTQKANDEALLSKEIVLEASKSVIALKDEVASASTSINTMNENTQNIISVLSVIGEIAEQTNLLALNAAIEAARAGEQGRGFAVVADEVRTLAARTQSSTAEIDSILTTLRSDASSAVSAMDVTKASCDRTVQTTARVSASLDTMTNFIVEINDLSTQIATASEEQSCVTEEVNRNMNNILEMVQQLTVSGQSSVDSTLKLTSANSQLHSLVNKFKV